MDLDSDDEGPEDVGFSQAKLSAAERTRSENEKALDLKKKRKAALLKKQAWFQETKANSKSGRRKKTEIKDTKNSEAKTSNPATDKAAILSVEDDQSDLEQDIPEITVSSPDPRTAVLVDKMRGIKVQSLNKSSLRYGAWRSDAARFAQERFNPPGVRRIPASEWTSIVAKRQSTRTPK